MGRRMGAALALVMGVIGLAGAAGAEPVKVRIDSGVLVGTAEGEVLSFKGVPYAQPPIGPLRWAPPKRPADWRGEQPAQAYGAVCPQHVYPNRPNEGGAMGPTNEDCLFLNVWAPKSAKGAPVMLWVHGGSNMFGAGSLGAYEGGAFVRDGIILVTINYRLGALGFFAHPALTRAAAPGEPLANYGLLDQIAALEWVKRNIAAFGGDPANVTLFGESAGGTDTLTLLGLPAARGLFARAIVESGGGWTAPHTLAKAEATGQSDARKAGASADATLAQLRALPADALVAAAARGYGPVVDGRLLKESPSQAIARGHAANVPLMIGSNSYEASLMKLIGLPPRLMLATVPASVKAAYADLPDDEAKANATFTDAVMGGPARWVAAQTGPVRPTYLYHFSYVLQSQRAIALGAEHAAEIPYVFDTQDKVAAMRGNAAVSAADRAMAKLVHSCWASFARTGVPTCAGAPAWPAYTPALDTLMEFDDAPHLVQHFRKAQMDVQEARALPTLEAGR